MSVAKKSAVLNTLVEFEGFKSIPGPETCVSVFCSVFSSSPLAYNFSFLLLLCWQLQELWLELVSVVPGGAHQGGGREHDLTVVIRLSSVPRALAVPGLCPPPDDAVKTLAS